MPHGKARPRLALAVALACAYASGLAGVAAAREVPLAAGEPLPALAPGDVLALAPGVHPGPWTIDVADVTVRAAGAVLDGGGQGTVLTLRAPGIRVEDLTVTGVGGEADLYAPDAAVAAFGCDGCVIERLVLRSGTSAVRVEGSRDVRLVDLQASGVGRGPGVTAFETPGLVVQGGRFEGFLDGLYLERADGARVEGAVVERSVRYGLHVMFTVGVALVGNEVRDGGVGSAVMYGRDALVQGNRLAGHRGPMAFGLLVQEEVGTRVIDNDVRGNAVGLLIVAAPGLRVEGGVLAGNGVGALLQRPPVAGLDGSTVQVAGVAFEGNAADLAVADPDAALTLRGNAYDRAPRLDLDGDGVVDVPFVATSAFAARTAEQPDLALLAHGPGIALWGRLEAQVPGVRATTFADPASRLAPPAPRAPGAGLAAAGLAVALLAVGALGARGWA
ncbi:MAG: right-handed parallel beta-helix repeat-containing protein [Trueperaceae bacterium]|nr:right-handed parallel beta-helix repeat-containing protein [Trueperaceae bacterium]